MKLFDVSISRSTVETAHSRPAVHCVDAAVSNVTSAYEPFTVRFPRLNRFPDVVYGEVDDDGRITELNNRIYQQPHVTTLDRDGDNFIPHLTLGYSQNGVNCREFIESNRELDLPAFTVDTLSLVACDVGGRPPAHNQLETSRLRTIPPRRSPDSSRYGFSARGPAGRAAAGLDDCRAVVRALRVVSGWLGGSALTGQQRSDPHRSFLIRHWAYLCW